MTTDQFRALETLSGSGHSAHHKTDDLLAATVAGFTSLTRPTRHDSQQFEDLALPLLETATPRAKRQVSAILAQHDAAPRKLVLALANDNIEVSAPLLLRSPILKTGDFMNIIDKNGLSHARVIARRQPVDPLLLPLLENYDDEIIKQALNAEQPLPVVPVVVEAKEPEVQSMHYASAPATSEPSASKAPAGSPASIPSFRSANTQAPAPQTFAAHDLGALSLTSYLRPALAEHLIDMALLIDNSLFRTALADALDVSYMRAETIIGTWPNSQLPLALKAIGLTAQDTYLILTAVLGTIHGEREQLREFVHIYRSISSEQASAAVRRWKADDVNEKLRNQLRDMAENATDSFTNAANSDSTIQHKKAQ